MASLGMHARHGGIDLAGAHAGCTTAASQRAAWQGAVKQEAPQHHAAEDGRQPASDAHQGLAEHCPGQQGAQDASMYSDINSLLKQLHGERLARHGPSAASMTQHGASAQCSAHHPCAPYAQQ